AYDSCLIFFPMLHGKQLITVEDLGDSGNLHPVQQAMVDTDGSQCGFCTPGFIMSLFALYKQPSSPTPDDIQDALTGNLCRCTGYRPITEAAKKICMNRTADHFTQDEPGIIQLLSSIDRKKTISVETLSQRYYIPFSLNKALKLKVKYPEALIVNGATDVALRVTKKKELLPVIIDLSHVPELKKIIRKKKSVAFGAGVCMEDIRTEAKKYFPALYSMLSVFGSMQIRNKATLGGNIGSASPIGDTPPVLMAYDAVVVLQSETGKREIKLRDFISGYRTTMIQQDEIITSVIVPKPQKNSIIKSYKVSKRKDLDISTVSGCFNLNLNEKNVSAVHLFFGGMAAMTKQAVRAEQFLTGQEWTRENVEGAMKLIDEEFTPISDARSGAEARKIMARNLLLKFWSETSKG
ncbi:MAG: xanthine dehydrogenase small subunit, partial [Bacteroidia bacterium]|nr:xanthine dehydrogenase small subunit [Bacteroidia bacterium]